MLMADSPSLAKSRDLINVCVSLQQGFAATLGSVVEVVEVAYWALSA